MKESGLCISVCFLAAVCVFLAACASESNDPIRIGAVISITGAQQQHGTIVKGMTMAADEINQQGGINGRKIEIVVADAASTLEGGRRGFAALEAESPPVAYVTATSRMSLALAPLAGEHKVPLLGLVATSPDFSRKNEWCFRYWTSSDMLVPPVLKLLRSLEADSVAVLYQDDELGRSVLQAFRPAAEAAGVKVGPVPFGMGEKNLAPYIDDHAAFDAIYVVGFAGTMKNALRAIRHQNYKGHVITFNSGSDPAVRTMPEAAGTYTVSSRVYDMKYPFAKEMRGKYEERFGIPLDHRAASGYDAVNLLAELLERTSVDREALRAALAGGFIFPGLFGDIDVKSGERDFLLPMEAARIIGGEVVFLE